jgi:putative Mg2+ transporter-C (MgtC) family protein
MTGISDGELLLRLGLSVVLCGAIGLEREARGQAAGLRTHILVGLGSTLFTLVSAYGFEDAPHTNLDPTRISAQIVTGIGFLGAGTIIRHGLTVRGLTTAAALWIVAAIGMAVGAGYYLGAIVTTAIILVALVGFRRMRPALLRRIRTDFVSLELELGGSTAVGDVFSILSRHGITISGMESERDEDRQSISFELTVPPGADLDAAIDEVRRLAGVNQVELRGWGSPTQTAAALGGESR